MLAGADLLEQAAVEDLEAERDPVDADLLQVVVALEVAVRRRLHADQETELLLDPQDVRLEDVEVGVALVVPGVEVDVGDARLAARRPHHFEHLVDRLLVGVVDAEVQARPSRTCS